MLYDKKYSILTYSMFFTRNILSVLSLYSIVVIILTRTLSIFF